VNPEDQILDACVAAFFPDVHGRDRISSIIKRQVFGGAAVAEIQRVDSNCREVKARLFCETATSLRSNFSYWLQGMDKDVLSEFPAHRLIRVLDDVKEVVNWEQFWISQGGRIFAGKMIALKWDPIWWKISAFNLPFAPFQLGSGYELEDVDRSESESLGFKIPNPLTVTFKIQFDPEDLRRRIAAQVAQLC